MNKCQNINHKRIGIRLATNKLICLDCRDERMSNNYINEKPDVKVKGKPSIDIDTD